MVSTSIHSPENFRLMQIGIQYGSPFTNSGTSDEIYAARDLGMQIEARLQAVGGDTSWSLNKLEYAEKPNAVPQMPDISVNNITDKSASVNWFTGTQYTNKPTVTGFHFVLKNIDSDQTITEDNFMSGQMNSYVTNLETGTNYKGYIIAVNAIGNSPENSIGFKTTGIKVEPEPEPEPEPIIISTEVQAILTKFDNNDYTYPSWLNENITWVKDGRITSNEFLNVFNNLLQAGTIIDKTIPVEKLYDVNTYRINEFGGTFNIIVYQITGLEMLELEKEFLVTISGRPTPSDQEIRDFYNFVDTSININSISVKLGAFTLKDGRVKGRIDYKTTELFNPYYYNKPIYSWVTIYNQSGAEIKIGDKDNFSGKQNILNFTTSERDEFTNIDEKVGDVSAITLKLTLSKISVAELLSGKIPEPFSHPHETEIVAEEIGLKPCPIGQHRNFNGKCVADNQPPVGGKPNIIELLGGVTALLGTLALLGSKRS